MAFNRAERQAYRRSETGKAAERRYRESAGGRALSKARQRRYLQSPKGRAARRRAKQWQRLRAKYGLSRAAWDAMLIAQAGRCGLCGEPMRDPVVDHNHTTGAIRDLLCAGCNTGVGWIEKPGFPSVASTYLARHNS